MRSDRGSVTIWLALASFVMVVLVGVAVDLSGQVYASQHAHDVASQAARVAGQQLDAGQAMKGGANQVNTAAAVAAARTYISSAGMEGEVVVTGGGAVLAVTTTSTYETKFLSIIGLNALRVTGTSQARIVRAVNGTER